MSQSPGARSSRHYHPVRSLIAARVREFLREPAAIFWVYVFPLVMVVALGVAFRNRPVDVFKVAVQEGPEAARLASTLNGDARFRATVTSLESGRVDLRTGRADVLVLPTTASPLRCEYLYDPTRPTSLLARNATDDLLQRAAGRQDVIGTSDSAFEEPGGRYIDFLVPGLLGMGLMGGGLWGVGFAVVDMRIRKLLKRYLATPMRRGHFLGAVMASRLVFMIPEVVLLLVFARIFFGVSSLGGYTAVGVLILLGAMQFSGIGLLVASRAQTIESVSGIMNAVMLPMWIGSGIFFSTERFPAVVQPLLQIIPLTPLIHALRAVMLEGRTLLSLGGELALIVGWGLVTFVLALKWFRWR